MARILFAIGQTPFDPTSGAAQATLHLAELLAQSHCKVRSLATSGTEGVFRGTLPHGRFEENGVHHHVLPVSPELKHSWHHVVGRQYDRLFDENLRRFRPDILFTFGDDLPDQSRRARASAANTKVVFCLHNESYLAHQPDHVSMFLCPSQYLAGCYRSAWGTITPIKVLPTPINPKRVVAPEHEPVFVTFINPQPAKGLWFMIRFAEQLGARYPEIPLRIIEGRATAVDFLAAAKSSAIQLEQYPNLFFSPSDSDVREIWSTTRILLAPAVWNEPAGRTPVEAMLNGAVPVVSTRGGLPEQVGAAGRTLALPDWMTPLSRRLPDAWEVEPWLASVAELCHDESVFTSASTIAGQEAKRFSPPNLQPQYMSFIDSVL